MNRHFACSDLHGMWQLWEQIDAYCDETDTIFFLGDAADRGPDGLRLMKTLLIDKRVKYIKGNHEDMKVISLLFVTMAEILLLKIFKSFLKKIKNGLLIN